MLNGENTHIDFVLSFQPSREQLWLLVAECKRINPSYSNWCFTRSGYKKPSWLGNQPLVEVLKLKQDGSVQSCTAGDRISDNLFDISFTLKSNKKGDDYPVSDNKDAISNTCSQLMLGINGLMNSITSQQIQATFSNVETITFYPVIFTTADLYVTDSDLKRTDLYTGELQLDKDVQKKDFIYLQYPQSPGLTHELDEWFKEEDDWATIIARRYVRSIAIVSPTGIQDYLQRTS